MTGILVALLVIVTAALCFLLGMIFGVWAANEANEAEKKNRIKQTLAQGINSELFKTLYRINEEDQKKAK